jgi:hypothetical protein
MTAIANSPARRFGLAAVSLAAMFILAVVPAAFAGKGGNGGNGANGGKPSDGSSSLSLVLMDGATQAAHHGRVTFDVSTTATDRPFVGLRCWQGTNWVLDGYVGYFPGAMGDPWFTLSSPYWADGVEASCTARLFSYDRRGNQNVLTTMTFPVAP